MVFFVFECLLPIYDVIITLKELRKLAKSIYRQIKDMEMMNRLAREDIERSREREDSKNDKLKKLHPSILNMLQIAASTDGD